MTEPTKLYPFRFFDQIRGRWVTARYKATLDVIQTRYPQYEITGAPEIRAGGSGQFTPPGAGHR